MVHVSTAFVSPSGGAAPIEAAPVPPFSPQVLRALAPWICMPGCVCLLNGRNCYSITVMLAWCVLSREFRRKREM
eukprot:864240-Pyramimonas_sp.AAC.1